MPNSTQCISKKYLHARFGSHRLAVILLRCNKTNREHGEREAKARVLSKLLINKQIPNFSVNGHSPDIILWKRWI